MGVYNEDPILNWLAAHFDERLVEPCDKARAAFQEIVKLRNMTNERKNITQPPDWWAAWETQAQAEGKSLSEWVGQACNAKLPPKVAKKLTERPAANRPPKAKD